MFGASFISLIFKEKYVIYILEEKRCLQMLFHSTRHAIWKLQHFSLIEHLPKNSLSNFHTGLTKISAHKGPSSGFDLHGFLRR